MNTAADITTNEGAAKKYWWPGVVYWLIVFVLYLPASQAGRVGDFGGWVTFLNGSEFIDYLNRKGSGIPSLYQFTQLASYIFYRLFGTNAWLWHLLYITLHALNALLLFTFFRRLFSDAQVNNGGTIAFTGVLLFCVCPHISEVIVYEPSFHFLLGLLLMLIVIHCALQFIKYQKTWFAIWGGIAFFLSTYSIEYFYLTPLLTASLILYYYLLLNTGRKTMNRALLLLIVPQVLFFLINLGLLYVIYHEHFAHVGSTPVKINIENLSKGPKYIFHIFFFGRFFPDGARKQVYRICEAIPVLVVFYGLLVVAIGYCCAMFRKFAPPSKVIVLVFLWVLAALVFLLPLWFPYAGLSLLDRYTYVFDAFAYVFLALLLYRAVNKYVFIGIVLLYALLNVRLTHKVNTYWKQSGHIINNLVETFPNDPSKKILLLNLPEALDGVQMLWAKSEGEFKMLYNATMPVKITNPVYDVMAHNYNGPADGAHVLVINDSTLRVTLNQWGTWWIYYDFGGVSYDAEAYKVNMVDPGHVYELVLRQPESGYKVLYVAGDQWKVVDWQKKNVDQY